MSMRTDKRTRRALGAPDSANMTALTTKRLDRFWTVSKD